MTKAELIETVSTASGLSKKDAGGCSKRGNRSYHQNSRKGREGNPSGLRHV